MSVVRTPSVPGSLSSWWRQANDLYAGLIGPHYGANGKTGAPLVHSETVIAPTAKAMHDLNTVEMMGYRIYNGNVMATWSNGRRLPSSLQVSMTMASFSPHNDDVSAGCGDEQSRWGLVYTPMLQLFPRCRAMKCMYVCWGSEWFFLSVTDVCFGSAGVWLVWLVACCPGRIQDCVHSKVQERPARASAVLC